MHHYLIAAAIITSATMLQAGTVSGPTPYLSFADSPYSGQSFSYFYLENFEGNSLSTPGVTASAGGTSLSQSFSGAIVDSVDSDDGSINGGCIKAVGTCISWFTPDGLTGVSFTFSAAVLGALPTSAGIVWTDGVNTITFKAYDQNGILIGTATGNHADGSFFNGTSEDRFYGATNAGGISKISISGGSAGLELDHLQYGLNTGTATPEPSTWILFGGGLTALLLARARRTVDLPPSNV